MSYPWFPAVADRVPCGEQGIAKVDRVTITKGDAKFANLRSVLHGTSDRVIPGDFTRLFLDGVLIMSDTYHEQYTNLPVKMAVERVLRHQTECRVLISGLGLGMLLPPLLDAGAHVTVLEKHQDVIDLVSPHYFKEETWAERLVVLHADAFEWKPPRGEKWDVIYHDIWFDICTDNLDELGKLKRRFGSRVNRENGSQFGWQEDDLRYNRRRNRRSYRMGARAG